MVAQIDDLDPDEVAELDDRFQREIFPVLTPLGVGPGQPFPYISGLSLSLGVLARDPESGEERFARVKVPEGLPRFFAVGKRGRMLPLENVRSRTSSTGFSPGMEILERSVFRVTRDADFEVSDEADDLLEAVELELLRRRFGDVVRVEVSSSTSRGDARAALRWARRRARPGLRDPRPARPRGPRPADRPRPAGAQVRAVARGDAVAARACEEPARPVRGDPPQRLPRPPAVRVVRGQLRGVRAGRRPRPRRDRDEDCRLPDERRQPARAGVDPVRRGRQAERLPRRAEGALRRAPQHRVVARPGAGGRARRLRLPRPEGAREDDARRPARGRRAPAVRPRRHRQLPRRDRPLLRGPEPVHRRPGDRGGHRLALQLPDGLRASVAVPEDPRRAVRAAHTPDRADPGRRSGGSGRQGRARSGSR